MDSYTLVIAVDRRHLQQLAVTWPTWVRHKPEFDRVPLLVIYDHQQVAPHEIAEIVKRDAVYIPWPPARTEYPQGSSKWDDHQRYKMLASFIHIPGRCVETKYWLKLDVDTVATGHPHWIDDSWFDDRPAIVAQAWHYTKPADQMLRLDQWVTEHADKLPAWAGRPPLNLVPKEGSSLVKHKRIISWCGFFETGFTLLCSIAAEQTCGYGHLPVPSQDGFMFYCATRLGLPVRRIDAKSLGFEHWTTFENISKATHRALHV